jgi:hypothetical protein
MAMAMFTIADRLGGQVQHCCVPGCTRTWVQLSTDTFALQGFSHETDPATAGMCAECRETFKRLRDIERTCARPGCKGTWVWTAMEQLEAHVAGLAPPSRLCRGCQSILDTLQDRDVPCSVPGCTHTARLTKMQQLFAQDAPLAGAQDARPGRVTLTGPMCDSCTRKAHRLRDREVSCGIHGCTRTWIWKADEQLVAFAAGKSMEPPRRMCDVCRKDFGGLVDQEIRCRMPGCKNTWTWSRSEQWDACVAGQPPPQAPKRMCQRCFDRLQTLKDTEYPCRRPGCSGVWIDRKESQLIRAIRGKTGLPHPRLCDHCLTELEGLEDRQIPCRTENCSGSWIWTREQQLLAGVKPAGPADASASKSRKARRSQPPQRRCAACVAFLRDRKTLATPCSQCGTPIYWPPESQLQTHLGNWAMPTLCGACKLAQVQAAHQAAREEIRHQLAQPQGTMPMAPLEAAEHGQ